MVVVWRKQQRVIAGAAVIRRPRAAGYRRTIIVLQNGNCWFARKVERLFSSPSPRQLLPQRGGKNQVGFRLIIAEQKGKPECHAGRNEKGTNRPGKYAGVQTVVQC